MLLALIYFVHVYFIFFNLTLFWNDRVIPTSMGILTATPLITLSKLSGISCWAQWGPTAIKQQRRQQHK